MTPRPRLLGEEALDGRLERLLEATQPDARHVVGWATIDLDRLGPGENLPDDDLLGARARRLDVARIALEPNTEGRLAGALARHGEGPLALYLLGAAPPPGVELSRPGEGPFGRQRLVLGGPPRGPHLILVTPATIER